jgi:XRE family transcriptional regulator, regulator of sulfur utilization
VTRPPTDPGPLATALPNALSVALRACRIKRGLSQEVLAARAGVDRTYVQKIEKATKHPSFATVAQILVALDVSWAELGSAIDVELQRQRDRLLSYDPP